MNYSAELNRLIATLKADKATNPKWRNKLVSRLEEVECMVPKLSTIETTSGNLGSLASTAPYDNGSHATPPPLPPVSSVCICPSPDVRNRSCTFQHVI